MRGVRPLFKRGGARASGAHAAEVEQHAGFEFLILEALADQIPDQVKEARNQALLQILADNSVRRNQLLIGTVEEVLVEGRDKTGLRLTGRTRGNRVTVFDGSPDLVGSLVGLRVTRTSVSTLYGELEPAATLISSACTPAT